MKKAMAAVLAIFAALAGSAAAQDSDNCCGVDGRVCSTDAEWDRGYYDRQAGLCGAPTVAASSTGAAAGDITWIEEQNCCHRSGSCATDGEWTQGYHDFHAGLCGVVPAELSHLAVPEHERAKSAEEEADVQPQGSSDRNEDGEPETVIRPPTQEDTVPIGAGFR